MLTLRISVQLQYISFNRKLWENFSKDSLKYKNLESLILLRLLLLIVRYSSLHSMKYQVSKATDRFPTIETSSYSNNPEV